VTEANDSSDAQIVKPGMKISKMSSKGELHLEFATKMSFEEEEWKYLKNILIQVTQAELDAVYDRIYDSAEMSSKRRRGLKQLSKPALEIIV